MSRRRRSAAEAVAAIARGGLGAIEAAEQMLDDRTQIQIRVTSARKRLYEAAARKAGQSLSAWMLARCDAALR